MLRMHHLLGARGGVHIGFVTQAPAGNACTLLRLLMPMHSDLMLPSFQKVM